MTYESKSRAVISLARKVSRVVYQDYNILRLVMRSLCPTPLPPPSSANRELKQSKTATSTRKPSNKRFNERNNGCARTL